MFIGDKLKVPPWKELRIPLYVIGVLILLVTILQEGSVKRWIDLRIFKIQAVDFSKLFFIYALSLIWTYTNRDNSIKKSLFLFITHFIPFVFVVIQPDLGSSLFFIFLFYIYLFVSYSLSDKIMMFYILPPLCFLFSLHFLLFIGIIVIIFLFLFIKKNLSNLERFVILFMCILPGLSFPFLWNNILKEYQRKRILYFLNPSKDPRGAGWQILQGKIAVGSGGLKGKGYMKGVQKNLAYLPYAHNDFAFAAFAEEWGFIGLLFLLLIYFYLFKNLLSLSKSLKGFYMYFSFGVFASLFYSFLLNIGGVLGLLPLTGIPLPFFSYGGSNFVTNSLLLSLVLSFDRSRFYKG
jgi:rod shape determining protein RodA